MGNGKRQGVFRSRREQVAFERAEAVIAGSAQAANLPTVKTRSSSVLIASLLAVLISAEANRCYGAAITVQNSSFESPVVGDSLLNSDADGWSETGNATDRGVLNPNGFNYAGASSGLPLPGTADGFQLGLVRDPSAALFQNVGALQPNTRYTLTVAFGDSLVSDPVGRLQMVASPSGAVLADDPNVRGINGTFVDRSIFFTTGSDVSGDLLILLRCTSGDAHFDTVRLDATRIPEPASASAFALATASLLLAGTRSRRVSARYSHAARTSAATSAT